MKILSNKKINFILALSAIFLPGSVLASSVSVSTSHSEFFVGDTIVFSVRIDSEGKNINAVGGEILLDHAVDTALLESINTSDSAFSLWPQKPLPSERNTSVSFVGGAPSGLTDNDATIFNIVFKLEKAGQISFSPNNIEVFLHDGKGTKDIVSTKDLVINVLPKRSGEQPIDDWNNIISNDTTPPEPFEIYLGQDDSVFDGKKFAAYNTTDKQSGIAYYEVIEDGLSPVRSGETYILKEQDKPVDLKVIAYDSAGNSRESVYKPGEKDSVDRPDTSDSPYSPEGSYRNFAIIIAVLLLLAIIVFMATKKRKKKNAPVKK